MASLISPRASRSRSRSASEHSEKSDGADNHSEHSELEEGQVSRSQSRSRSLALDRNDKSKRNQTVNEQKSPVHNDNERSEQIPTNNRNSSIDSTESNHSLPNSTLRGSSQQPRSSVHNPHGENSNSHPYSRGGFSNSFAAHRGAYPSSAGYSSRGSEYYRGANRFEYRPPRRDIDDTRGRTDYKRGVDFYQNFPNQLNMGAPVQQKYGKKRFRGDDAFYIDAPIVDEPPKNGQLIAHSHDRNDDVTVQVFEFGTNKERCKCITQGFIRNPWNGIFDPAKAAPRTAQKRSRSPETKDTYFRNRTLYDRQSNIVTYIYHQKSQDPKTNGNYVTIRQQVRGPPDSTHLYYTEPVEEINSERLHEIKPGNPRFESRIKSKSIAQTEPRPTPNPTVRRSPSPEHSQPMERPTKRARTMDAHEPTSLETFEKVKFQVPNSPKRNESVAQVDPTPRNANILAQLLNMLDPTPESFAILKQVADKLKK